MDNAHLAIYMKIGGAIKMHKAAQAIMLKAPEEREAMWRIAYQFSRTLGTIDGIGYGLFVERMQNIAKLETAVEFSSAKRDGVTLYVIDFASPTAPCHHARHVREAWVTGSKDLAAWAEAEYNKAMDAHATPEDNAEASKAVRDILAKMAQ